MVFDNLDALFHYCFLCIHWGSARIEVVVEKSVFAIILFISATATAIDIKQHDACG